MERERKRFADILRSYRGDKSQVKMANLLDISATYYSELERGIKLPSYEILDRIIKQSGKDANYWFGIDTADTPSFPSAPPPSSADATIATIKEDAETILSLLKMLSDDTGARRLAETINRDTSIPQIIAVIAQLRAYLSEIDHDMLPEPDRRTISDLLAACQRVMDDSKHTTKPLKQGRRLA